MAKFRNHKELSYLLLLCIIAIAAGCASIGNPSGGPRDEEPPRFVRANPAPGAINVAQNIDRIKIDFNEIVNVKDAFAKVVVSPPSASIPRVASQGKTVTVSFQDTLLPNTTYTIDFGNAIEDNNEANPLENFSYTFSTGPSIDSLRISGIVLSAHSLEPMQGKLVGIHSILEDSVIYSRRFDRVAKTDDRGRFSVEGIAPGRYRIYALDDTNSDYLYSSPEEEMAFYDAIISPSTSSTFTTDSIFNKKTGELDTTLRRQRTLFLPNDILLRSFLTSRRQQYISAYERLDSTRLQLTFAAPQEEMPEISIVGAPTMKNWAKIERSAGNDSITLWLSRPSLVATDTLRLRVAYQKLDSLRQYVATIDTLRFTTSHPKAPAAKAKKENRKSKKDAEADSIAPPAPTLKFNIPTSSSHDIYAPLTLLTDAPLQRLDTTLFRLEVKVDTIWTPVSSIISERRLLLPDSLLPAGSRNLPVLHADSLNPRKFTITYPWKYGTSYRLTADTLAMQSIYGLPSAPLLHEFKIKEEKEYCSLTIRVADWPSTMPAFLELLSTGDSPVRVAQLHNSAATFTHLQPGKYYLRIINDLNANSRWDTGDIMRHLQPEEAYYYPKAINIKQNWNKEETWRVFDTPVDAMKPEALLKNKPTQRKSTPNRKKTATSTTEEDDDDL